jgi:Leucine-rich repeat (LRR) protein/serine/threonine protein kinase
MAFIDRYDNGVWRIEAQIGAGTYGKVYKICKEDHGLVSTAALKVIPVPQSSEEIQQIRAEGMDEASIARYLDEAVQDIMKEIKFVTAFRGTANIVSCEDFKVLENKGELGYNVLIRMELLESLEKVLAARRLGEAEAAKVGIDICKALELLAKNKTIHRDVKPGNIMLSKHGDYKLGDFGIARQIERTSGLSQKKGTFNFMAPEVYRGQEYGASVDFYSLGLVLYRIMNNGRLPFIPANAETISLNDREAAFERRMKGEDIPPPAYASKGMADIILKACVYYRARRYQSALEMRSDLERLLIPGTARIEGGVAPVKPDSDATGTIKEAKPSYDKKGGVVSVRHGFFKQYVNDKSVVEPYEGVEEPYQGVAGIAGAAAAQSAVDAEKTIKGNPSYEIRDDKKDDVAPAQTGGLGQILKIFLKDKNAASNKVKIGGKNYSSSIANLRFENKKLSYADLLQLSYFTNLVELEMINCEIEDVRPLAGLVDLACLNLHGNKIADARPLSGLINLVKLDLSGNKIADARPLLRMVNLTDLDLADNQMNDVRPLSEMVNLINLRLTGNTIIDMSPLSGLRNLSQLYLNRNRIKDLGSLPGLANITLLDLSENQIVDVNHLSTFRSLSVLNLSNNRLTEVNSLSELPFITNLDLSCNLITDVSLLSKLRLATHFYLSNNNITDISFLSELSGVILIDLKHNQIVDLSPLSDLTSIAELDLSENEIKDVDPLSGLIKLTRLDLSNNQIRNLDPLSELYNLAFLDLSRNHIANVSPLSGLYKLDDLSLAHNPVRDLQPLCKLVKPKKIDLSGAPADIAQTLALRSTFPNCSITR